MKSLRQFLAIGIVVLLGIGYLCSQYFWFQGRAPEWSQMIDTPPVAWAALLLLVAAVVLWLVREPKENS